MTQKKQGRDCFTWIDRMSRIKPKRRLYFYVFILYILSIHVESLFALEVDEEKKTASPPVFELVEGQDGGRNPFTLPKGVFNRAKLTGAAEKEKKEKPLVLEAIVTTNAKKRQAAINGTNVEEGDEISGKKVVEIGKDFVVLSGDIENIRLKLKRQPHTIIVTDETGALKRSENSGLAPEMDDQNPETGKSQALSWVENLKKLK